MTLNGLTVLIFCALFVISGQISGEIVDVENNGSYAVEESYPRGNSQLLPHPFVHNNTTKSSEFPPDLFSEDELRKGAVVLHLIGALYSFGIIGVVCGDFFLPSIDCICCDLNLSQDVAAATFMSFATTAPELFIILIATFITKSDIGLGAVIGSGMFNILGVATIGGLAAVSPIKLDWWPLYRDSLVYVVAPIGLAAIVSDGIVTLGESICLIVYYFLYFVIMFYNRSIRRKIKHYVKKIKSKGGSQKAGTIPRENEKSFPAIPTISISLDQAKVDEGDQMVVALPQEANKEVAGNEDNEEYEGSFKAYFINYEDSISLRRKSCSSTGSCRSSRSRKKSDKSLNERKWSPRTSTSNPPQIQQFQGDFVDSVAPKFSKSLDAEKKEEAEKNVKENVGNAEEDKKDEDAHPDFFSLPEGSFWEKLIWLIMWPATFVLYYTIPDCRLERWRRFYLLTFLMCVFWIGVSSYFGTWMIYVVGDTIGIPDSVMGLTFLALGGSMPEAISTFIMARQGEGGLGFSNSLGGNTMDICLCLGLPWLIQNAIYGPVEIESEGLQYNSIALFAGIFVLLSVVTHTKFHMNKRLGIVCSTFYLMFIVISILIEVEIIPVESR